MLRRSCFLFAASSSKLEPAKISPDAANITPSQALYKWVIDNDCRISDVELRLKPTGRGMFATKAHRTATTLVSVPLEKFAINAERLSQLPFVKKVNPPSKGYIRDCMLNAGVLDTVMSEQMHLAFLLATERMNPNSELMPYFDVLPHPAVDDSAIDQMHRLTLDEGEKMEWNAYREDFVNLMKHASRKWETPIEEGRPPIQVLDWAWRTVLCRQHLLPDHGAPPVAYKKLGFVHWSMMNGDKSIWKRMLDRILNRDEVTVDYKLVPTLVPFLDAIDHAPSANVAVEVTNRGGFGTCVELQAIADIKPDEEIVLTFSRSSTIAFTLYRFGFIPL